MNPLQRNHIISSLLKPFRLSQQKTYAAIVARYMPSCSRF